MPRAPHKAVGPSGMTLIEILVALSVATLILTVALSIYFTFSNSLRRLGDPLHREMTIALDTLRHDIAASVQASFTNNPTFELESVPVGLDGKFLSTLALHTAHSPPGEQGLPQMTIVKVRYGMQNDSAQAGASLVRESIILWGPDAMSPPVSNTICHGISNFEVRVLDKGGWTNRWKSTPGHLLPRAARIRMEWQGAHTNETASLIVFIPAGNSFPASTVKTNGSTTGRTKPSRADSAAPIPAPPRATEKISPHAPP